MIKKTVRIGGSSRVMFCDHSNFLHNSSVKSHLLHEDNFHLSDEGTRVFANNIRSKVEIALDIYTRRR